MELTALMKAIQLLNKIYPKKYVAIDFQINSHPGIFERRTESVWVLYIADIGSKEFANEYDLVRHVLSLAEVEPKKETAMYVNDLLAKGGL